MKKVFLMLIVAFGATGLGLNAQETTKGPPARPGATQRPARRPPRPRRPRGATTRRRSRPFSMRSPRRSTPATPRPPPPRTRRRRSSSTSKASGSRAAPPSATSTPRRSPTTPGARSPSRSTRSASSARRRPSRRAGRRSRRPRAPGARDHPLHRRVRQARRPVAPGRRPRRARARPHPPRPPQGTGVAGGRLGQREPGRGRLHHLQMGRRRQLPRPRVHHEDRGPARALGHPADRLGPAEAAVQDLDLRLRGGLRRRLLDAQRQPVGDQGRGRRPGRAARVGHEHHHASGQGPHGLAVGGPDPRRSPRSPGSTSSSWCASPPRSASKLARRTRTSFFHSHQGFHP